MSKLSLIIVCILYYLSRIIFTPADSFAVRVLDVGQGDAILITSDNGSKILIDGGAGYEVDNHIFNINPFNCRLTAVILTHPHRDHMEGINRIMKRCKVDMYYYSPVEYDSQLYKEFRAGAVPSKELLAGDVLKIDDLSLHVLWPTKEFASANSKNVNLISTVILLKRGYFDGLFLGDAELQALRLISWSNIPVAGKMEFIKASHHGAANGFLTEMYKAQPPEFVTISVGKKNSFGHPSPEIIDYLVQNRIKYSRTDLDGTIIIRPGKGSF